MVPTAINVLQSGAYVYVTAYDSAAVPVSVPATIRHLRLEH